MKKLFLDDVRQPFDNTWIHVKSYKEFIEWIDKNGIPDVVSFDHDLSTEHYRKEMDEGFRKYNPLYKKFKHKTGLHCAEYLLKTCKEKGVALPRINIHSMNPVGAENIAMLVRDYAMFYYDEMLDYKIIRPYNLGYES